MKKILILSLSTLIIICTSCHKIEVNNFAGTYSYKTTGNVDISTDNLSLNHSLANEIGTMYILKNKSSDTYDVTIIMNEVGGGVYTAYGDIDGNEIKIASYERPLDLKLIPDIGREVMVSCQGKGVLKDGVLVIKQTYSTMNGSVDVFGKDITTVAEQNE